MAERDLMVPNWVDLYCPSCGAVDGQVDANVVNRADDPNYNHGCGYAGPFEWINPDPPSEVWAERSTATKATSEELMYMRLLKDLGCTAANWLANKFES